jgi:ankyrin repeat protein
VHHRRGTAKHGAPAGALPSQLTADGKLPAEMVRVCRAGHELVLRTLAPSQRTGFVTALDEARWTLLLHASATGHVNVAEILIEMKADVHATTPTGQTALHLAVTCQSANSAARLASILIQAEANPDARSSTGTTALNEAVRRHREGAATVLVSGGAQVDSATLITALHCGRDKIVQSVLSRADIARLGPSLLVDAVQATQTVRYLDMLVEFKADLEGKDEHGWTAILHAAQCGFQRN